MAHGHRPPARHAFFFAGATAGVDLVHYLTGSIACSAKHQLACSGGSTGATSCMALWSIQWRIQKSDKWRAIAAQTPRCRGKVLSIQYVYYITLGPTKGSGTEDKSFAEK